jgi:hemoglobin-like flavoprotein
MVVDMSYDEVSNVVESWEEIRRNTKDFNEVVGVKLFQKLFAVDPSAARVFSFGNEVELTDDFFKSKSLIKHAGCFITMIDKALGLLGPDIELLTETLMGLGHNHVAYGVQASHYPNMGQALLETLEEVSGDSFTEEVKNSWLEVYQALSYDMIRSTNRRRQSLC